MTIDTDARISIEDLVALDSTATLVVTVNNRYARRLVTLFSQCLGQRRGAMPIPDIVPFSAWLSQLAQQLSFDAGVSAPPHRLDAFAARHLWEKAIARAEQEHVLLDVGHAARHAMEADRLVFDWLLRVRPEEETQEYQRFCVWRHHYEQLLGELDAEDGSREYARLCRALDDGAMPAGVETVVTAGFAEFSPRQAALFESLRAHGIAVLRLADQGRGQGRLTHIVAPDADAQWHMAAQWAGTRLRDHPDGRFAIVAPGLQDDAVFAHRVLRDALRVDGAVRPYNVAVARPLAQWFHVRAALAWLRMLLSFALRRQCAPDVLGAALLAGACVGGRGQATVRVSYDVAMRRKGLLAVDRDTFSQWLASSLPDLHEGWLAWQADARAVDRDATVDDWVASFRRWLQCMGFPGPEAQSTVDYQVLQAFDDMLGTLAGQSAAFGMVDADTAFALLEHLAGETLFQPQRDPTARLDVLGLLESEGGQWDGVWVLGLTDEALPAAPQPNPLVPLPVLRKAGAPRATPERELAWATHIFQSLTASASQVWLCHPALDGEREMQPSPLLRALPREDFLLAPSLHEAAALQYLVDVKGPALAPGRKTTGGIGVIDTQARNPLWAFVKYRLGATALPGYAGVFDQNARGLFLHRAAELVWHMLESQQALLRARDSAALGTLVQQSVAQACDDCLNLYGPVLQRLESARAVQVLSQWLDMEARRHPFAVDALEKDVVWTHGPLTLSLRVDRIDRLDQGGLVVIDYKSTMGSVDPRKNWMRRLPVGLQLPFYAATCVGDVVALVLAKLHARTVETKGLAREDCGLPGVALVTDWPMFEGGTWEQVMAQWKDVIERLAADYGDGVAACASQRDSDLDYCDARPFLRLNEEVRRDR
jgi:probable DNA repair protein